MSTARVIAITAALAFALAAGNAQADLRGDAARLEAEWARHGGHVTRLAPLFVEHGRTKAVAIDGGGLAASAGCTTIAFLGVRTADFLVDASSTTTIGGIPFELSPHADSDDETRGTRSAGGAATLVRCGAERKDLGHVTIEMASPRGSIEVLVGTSERALAEPSEALPERAPGPLSSRGDTHGPIEAGPLAERKARASARALADGATKVVRIPLRAHDNGAGQYPLQFAGGCHRLDLMADVPPHPVVGPAAATTTRHVTDVDAEVRDAETGRLLAHDRADLPDARLDFCLGDTSRVELSFIGASGPVEVTLSDAYWPLPERIPGAYGKRARSGFAAALFRRHAPTPATEPMFESLGLQGTTSIPVEVEPGRCYIAAAAVLRGEIRTLRLSAEVGDRTPHDEATEREGGAAVAFCTDTEAKVRFEIEARGSSPEWALVMWPAGAELP